MDDNTIITFGIHKGKALANIPSTYLLYLISDKFKGRLDSGLKAYIHDNLDILNSESTSTNSGKVNKREHLPSTSEINYLLYNK